MKVINSPEPGYFRLRKYSRGPWVPAIITRAECVCTPGGGEGQAPHPWRPSCDRQPPLVAFIENAPAEIDNVWMFGTAIDEPEFSRLCALPANPEKGLF